MKALRKAQVSSGSRKIFKYRFAVKIETLSGIGPADMRERVCSGLVGKELFVHVHKTGKLVTTHSASMSGGTAAWHETLTLVATLYASRKREHQFSSKRFHLSLMSSAPGQGGAPSSLAHTVLNIADFAPVPPASEHETQLKIGISVEGGPVELSLTVSARLVREVTITIRDHIDKDTSS